MTPCASCPKLTMLGLPRCSQSTGCWHALLCLVHHVTVSGLMSRCPRLSRAAVARLGTVTSRAPSYHGGCGLFPSSNPKLTRINEAVKNYSHCDRPSNVPFVIRGLVGPTRSRKKQHQHFFEAAPKKTSEHTTLTKTFTSSCKHWPSIFLHLTSLYNSKMNGCEKNNARIMV